MVIDNHRAFHVVDATFAKSADTGKQWREPKYKGGEFRTIDLPFWLDSGRFRVVFETSKRQIDVNFFAVDCLRAVYLDGKQVLKQQEQCKPCAVWHPSSSKRCTSLAAKLELDEPGRHVLAIETKNIEEADYDQNRDLKLFFMHHRNAAFIWRLFALLWFSVGVWLTVSYWKTRDPLVLPIAHLKAVWRHRVLGLILAASLIPRFVIGPVFMTTDVSESALIYTENLVNKDDWHFAHLDDDYEAAKYFGRSHMHKPPGVYYQYAIPRLLFGFTEAYFPWMARLPGAVGDLIIAWVLWAVIRVTRGDWEGMLAAGVYALSAGVFITSSYVGRIDSLAVALLMLGLRQLHHSEGNRWFAVFFGAAVAWKQLALLIVPLLITSMRRLRWLLCAGIVTVLLCSPYLFDDPKLFLERLTMPQLEKGARGLSWLTNLEYWGWGNADLIAKAVTLGYMVALCVLPIFVRLNVWLAGALCYGLFIVGGKAVHEHYILWTLPFMLMIAFLERSVVALVAFMFAALSMALNTEREAFLVDDMSRRWALMLGLIFFGACLTLLIRGASLDGTLAQRALHRLRSRRPPLERADP
jgi:hypothetical protein